MGTPYIGEIRMFGGNFAPLNWAFCSGQLIPISQNDALFNLIGTTYGGDGVNTFALPDLQGRVPIHVGTLLGTPYQLGEKAGVETVTLTVNQIPSHNHAFVASQDSAGATTPENNVVALSTAIKNWTPFPPNLPMNASALQPVGGSQPHENMMPYLVITFVISLFGVFPSQN
jgi:microcystin-dependent protein